MDKAVTITLIRQKYPTLQNRFNERTRRLWAATEAHALGHGGITLVHHAIGMDIKTISPDISFADSFALSGRFQSGMGQKCVFSRQQNITPPTPHQKSIEVQTKTNCPNPKPKAKANTNINAQKPTPTNPAPDKHSATKIKSDESIPSLSPHTSTTSNES
jgi:hypothetical protein